MVFHSSKLVFMVFIVPGGFFMVFHGFRSVFLVFMVPGWLFHGSRLVFHGSRLAFSWFFSKMYLPELYPGLTIQSFKDELRKFRTLAPRPP